MDRRGGAGKDPADLSRAGDRAMPAGPSAHECLIRINKRRWLWDMLGRRHCGPKGKFIQMRFVRTILAIAIAISLAMLPVGVSASSLATSSDDMHATMQMGGDAEMAMDDCCPDMKGPAPTTDGYKCGMGFCCIGGALALGDIRTIAFERLAATASKIAIPADQVVSFRGSSPPFRPPRV